MSTKFSRRQFLKLAGTSAAGLAVAACASTPAPAPKATEAPSNQPAQGAAKTVRILLDSWAMGEMPFDTFAREFNESHPDVNIQL